MDCRILRHVTLKANGKLGCDDSIGYGIDLGEVALRPEWRLRNVFDSGPYRHVRDAFQAGRLPWPGTCEGCDLLSAGAPPQDTLARRLELLVEPTLACSLHCACCVRKQIIKGGRDTNSMDPAILRRFMQACVDEGIAVDQVHYIGWGEPLMHGDFRALFDIAKQAAPAAQQMVTTAGNVDFRSTVGDAPLDRLIVSCDGSAQAPYQQYRRGGDFDVVLQFMRDCRRYGDPGIFLEWKYILFEHNDSDEDLLRAQALADEVGVDSLLFIITNSKWHSERYTVDTSHQLPLRSLVASVSPAAAMNATAVECKPFRPRIHQRSRGRIDRATVSVGKFLFVEGWALGADGSYVDAVELVVDGRAVARSRTSLVRHDVTRVMKHAAGPKCGFMFRVPVDPAALPESIVVRTIRQGDAVELGGRAAWHVPGNPVKRRKDLPALVMDAAVADAAAPSAYRRAVDGASEQAIRLYRRVKYQLVAQDSSR